MVGKHKSRVTTEKLDAEAGQQKEALEKAKTSYEEIVAFVRGGAVE